MAASESYPEDLLYHPEHDWARIDGDEALIGVTWFAVDALGELRKLAVHATNQGQFRARQDDLDAQQTAMGRGQDPLELEPTRNRENLLRGMRRDVAPLVEHPIDRRDSDAG